MFKVGDKVVSKKYGEGIVLDNAIIGTSFPVGVVFEDGLRVYFTKEGRFYENEESEKDIVLDEQPVGFQVGDIVEAFGLKGVVVEINHEEVFPVFVYFNETQENEVFTFDGKFYAEHLNPTLKLIERPKKKVRETVRGYGIVFDNHVKTYYGLEDAKTFSDFYGKPFVNVTLEYDTEE